MHAACLFPNTIQQELQTETLFKFNTGFEKCCRVFKQDKKESIVKVQDSEIEKQSHDKHVPLVEDKNDDPFTEDSSVSVTKRKVASKLKQVPLHKKLF